MYLHALATSADSTSEVLRLQAKCVAVCSIVTARPGHSGHAGACLGELATKIGPPPVWLTDYRGAPMLRPSKWCKDSQVARAEGDRHAFEPRAAGADAGGPRTD